ncbi:hypothetical protein OGAPHI_003605 [Ogataea philodendri]|uniref:Uncharacterized protein n=1 Tax=Ogataea philodendri TaxID=1378263 RepID=A0A9P8T506_9ASCO|nr:uncharacterized protein OGAPHI_003605 [Ogataea philodendri]KAH3665421.1 hypothetical protein OGAPHI_003605 [Ogataea philodendri]
MISFSAKDFKPAPFTRPAIPYAAPRLCAKFLPSNSFSNKSSKYPDNLALVAETSGAIHSETANWTSSEGVSRA